MKKQVGRPKISLAKKKTAKIFINLTNEQKNKLEKIAEKEDLSLSQLCLRALKTAKLI